jgi:hypothetical protein
MIVALALIRNIEAGRASFELYDAVGAALK